MEAIGDVDGLQKVNFQNVRRFEMFENKTSLLTISWILILGGAFRIVLFPFVWKKKCVTKKRKMKLFRTTLK